MQIPALPLLSSMTLDKFFARSVYMRRDGNISLIFKGGVRIDL